MYIDFHAHVLPGADHGSDSVETSLKQLQQAHRYNVSTIVSTPHFYPHRHKIERFLQRRQSAFAFLEEARTPDMPEVKLGAEVLVAEGMEHLPDLDKLCIQGTNYILLEMPSDTPWPVSMLETIYEITVMRKLRPIIAHVDRYEWKYVRELLQLEVCAQINAVSLCRGFRKKEYRKLIRENQIHILGSDVHGVSKEYAEFAKAISWLGSNADLMMRNAAAILANEPIL